MMLFSDNTKSPPRKKDTSLPVSTILIDSKSEGDRATHTKVGRDAELRVARILGRIYGERNVVFDGAMATGSDGKPDVLLTLDPPVLVEVKTCTLFHKKRIFGAAKTFVHAWNRLSRYAKSKLMKRVMIIEYRHKDSYIYVWIKGEVVDEMIEKRLAKSENGFNVFHFDFRQALECGELLTERGINAAPAESPQEKMDEFLGA